MEPAAALLKRFRCTQGIVAGLLLVCLVSLMSPLAASGDTYPEKGKVVAVSISAHTDYVPISPPDSKGRSGGGEAFVSKHWMYRVETGNRIYVFEGGKKQEMNAGDDVEFRIDKSTVHVRAGTKDVKCRLASDTLKATK